MIPKALCPQNMRPFQQWLDQPGQAGIMDDTATLRWARPRAGKDSLAFID
jgi:hypothetical protein